MSQIKNDLANIKHGFIEIKKGIQIHYVEKGFIYGKPLVFIHGFPDSWNSFRLVLNEFSSSFHAYAIDLHGFGDSSKPERGFLIEDFAEDIIGFLDALNIEKASIVGHSMGSFVAQRVALLYPERVEKLVLVGSASKGKGNTVLTEALEIVNTLQEPIGTDFITEFQSGTTEKNVSVEFFNSIIQESLKAPLRVWKESLKGLTEVDYSKELSNIKHHTQIVWGVHDSIFPKEEQEILVNTIPNATLSVYQNAGHSLNWEEPKTFSNGLEQFLNS